MPRLAANLTLLFNELPFLDRFAAAAQAGFRGVEYLFPYAWQAQDLAGRLHAAGLTQVLFNLPAGDWVAGERGIASLPGREDEFKQGVAQAVHYARALECSQINCLAGLRQRHLDPQTQWDCLAQNLRWAAAQLAQEGITLMVEAINSKVDMPGFLLDTSAKAMALIDAVAAPNLKFQYDLYHMQIMEGDLLRTLQACLPAIGHIQFADNPGRHEPGTGEINFSRIFSALDEMGYRGWISAEFHPQDSTLASLPSLARWLT